jgi:hypothetical protein
MARINVLLNSRDDAIAFEAEEWQYAGNATVTILKGGKTIAQFPLTAVTGVWFHDAEIIDEQQESRPMHFIPSTSKQIEDLDGASVVDVNQP